MRVLAVIAAVGMMDFFGFGLSTLQGADEKMTGSWDHILAQGQKLDDRQAVLACVTWCEQHLDDVLNHETQFSWLARWYWSMGSLSDDVDEQKKWFRKGEALSDRMKQENHESAAGYYWWGIHHGEIVERSSWLMRVSAYGTISSAMEKVLELNPKYDGGGAYLVLGRIQFLSPIGSKKKSKENYNKAIELEPHRTTPWLFLAEWYLKKNMRAEARANLLKVLEVQVEPRYLLESKGDRNEARKILKEEGWMDERGQLISGSH